MSQGNEPLKSNSNIFVSSFQGFCCFVFFLRVLFDFWKNAQLTADLET